MKPAMRFGVLDALIVTGIIAALLALLLLFASTAHAQTVTPPRLGIGPAPVFAWVLAQNDAGRECYRVTADRHIVVSPVWADAPCRAAYDAFIARQRMRLSSDGRIKKGPSTTPAPSDSKWLHVALWSVGTLEVLDVATTANGAGHGYREANPLLRWTQDRPIRLGLIKSAVAIVLMEGLVKLHRTRPKLTLWIAGLLSAETGYVVWHNARINRAR